MPSIRFIHPAPASPTTLSAADGESLFEVAKRAGLEVETACVGKGTCGLCRVRVIEGQENLSPYNATEEKHLGNVYHLTKVRLSCQAIISGDVTVEITRKKRKKKKK